jgi:hypothetical protein
MTTSPFTEEQRATIKSLSKLQPRGKDYSAAPNKPLEAYIKSMRKSHPEMFQDAKSMKERVFVDEPHLCSFKRTVRTHAESPYRVKAA